MNATAGFWPPIATFSTIAVRSIARAKALRTFGLSKGALATLKTEKEVPRVGATFASPLWMSCGVICGGIRSSRSIFPALNAARAVLESVIMTRRTLSIFTLSASQ